MIELAYEMEFSSLSAALFVKMLITFTLFSEQVFVCMAHRGCDVCRDGGVDEESGEA